MNNVKLFNANEDIVKEIKAIEVIVKEINVITNNLISEITFFEVVDIKEISNPSEDSSFLHLVSHLYGLFYERSRVNTAYIINHMDSFVGDSIFAQEQLRNFRNLRTYYSHISKKNLRDKQIKDACFMWFYENGVVAPPDNANDWKILNNALLNNSIELLNDIKMCLQQLGTDEDFNFIKEEWLIQKTKDFPDHILTDFAIEICNNFDLNNINAYALIKKTSSNIRRRLLTASFEDKESLNILVKQYIEEELFTTDNIPCPVTGDDILSHFNVKGKEIGEIKKRAIDLHKENIYLGKKELINLLRRDFSNLLIR
ncbi:hypothetical protein [Paenibacillus glacialis]|uniref:Uncharacterized protein n=1 Tax=Paenibacillus glacialis TaxID=494026 RepID=A0A162Q002_9BACL|nr:hypothetical protein [Paenibacillus glacialis]OAB40900.1 hypothetical protein PGLA_17505 [Paenibacillus glacialis]